MLSVTTRSKCHPKKKFKKSPRGALNTLTQSCLLRLFVISDLQQVFCPVSKLLTNDLATGGADFKVTIQKNLGNSQFLLRVIHCGFKCFDRQWRAYNPQI